MADDPDQLRPLRDQLARRVKQILRQKVALSLPLPLPPELVRDLQVDDAREAVRHVLLAGVPVSLASADPPLPTLTDSELEAPIELPGTDRPPVVAGYEWVAEAGRGGQAIVYRMRGRDRGEDVAVKVLAGGAFADPRAGSRFRREVRILARLAHPNVVPVLRSGRTADGSPFLVMPYVGGRPVDEHAATLRGDGAVAALFATVADVLDAVHRAGVVHRDLKPSNVRVDADGVPHVLDFGLARTVVAGDKSRSLTTGGQVIGSLPWLSPEQARGRSAKVDGRADVYALGLMLCRAVAAGGEPPYRVDGTYDEVIDAILNHRRRVAGRRRDDPLRRVVLRCLAKRRTDRYPTAAALAVDLRRVAANAQS